MASDRVEKPFGYCAILVRNTVPAEECNGRAYIGLEHIEEGTLQLSGTGDGSLVTSQKAEFRAGDILFGKLRPYFRKVVRPRFDGVCSTDIWVVRAADGIDQGFLYYWMASKEFVDAATRGSKGTKMPRADWGFVAKCSLRVPPLPVQRRIAHILGALDDKIELNRRMNRTLERIAAAIFKSWFIDFDPVRAKADLPAGRQEAAPPARPGAWFVYALECEGGSIYIGHTEDIARRFDEHASGKGAEWTKRHPPKRIAYWEELSSEAAAIVREKKLKTGSGREWLKAEIARRDALTVNPTGLPTDIADLFPDSFQDSPLGPIPRGWQVKPFAQTVEVIGGGTPKTAVEAYWGGNIPWFSVVDAPCESDVWVVDTQTQITQAGVDNSSTRILPIGTTIISARGTVGRVALVGVPMAMNQSCYGVRGACDKYGFYTHFVTRAIVSRLQQRVHGAVFDTITRDTLKSVRVIFPPSDVINTFEACTAPLLERIRRNLLQSRTLASLRDTLLPKLLSGEIDVSALEGLAEEVAE